LYKAKNCIDLTLVLKQRYVYVYEKIIKIRAGVFNFIKEIYK